MQRRDLLHAQSLINNENSFGFFLCGIVVIANKTPAIVAWIPELVSKIPHYYTDY